MDFTNTIQALQKFGSNVVKKGKVILKQKKKTTSKNTLYNSFKYNVAGSQTAATLEFNFGAAEDYWQFVDEGVRGAGGFKGSGRMRGHGSPFKFGSKMPPRQPLIEWIKNKRLKGRSKKGRFITNESFGFLIQRAIYQRGLERTRFFSSPYEMALKNNLDNIIIAFAEDLEEDLVKNNDMKKIDKK